MGLVRCYVCGKEYNVCGDCETSRLNPWRRTACCVEHYQIRQVFLQYRDGHITVDEARQMLEGIGQTTGEGLNGLYQGFFSKVFEPIPVETKFKKAYKNEPEIVVEDEYEIIEESEELFENE